MAQLGSMRDVVGGQWTNLKGWPGPVAVYDDGPNSVWPADGVAFFEARQVPIAHITVFANPACLVFDVEGNNSPMPAVADAMKVRYDAGLPSVLYCNGSTFGGDVKEIHDRQLPLLGAESWPAPGVYVWAADWSGVDHSHAPWCPVQEVAVQWGAFGTFDQSTTVGPFPDQTHPLPEVPPVTDADIAKILQGIRALFTPGSELFDRVVQATIQGVKESGASITADDQVAIRSEVLVAEPAPAVTQASPGPVTPS